MAQWDVYLNPNLRRRDEVPYLVDLQSNFLTSMTMRLVAPLVPKRFPVAGQHRRLSPQFDIAGATFVLVPHESGPIDARLLRRPVHSLRGQAHVITDAVDAVTSGI